MNNQESNEYCPICYRLCSLSELESHVNKCIFLNSSNTTKSSLKRKRSPSPTLNGIQKCRIDSIESSSFIQDNATTSKTSEIHNTFSFSIPLTEQVQPKSLHDLLGQNKVLGKNTYLRSLLAEKEVPNLILWGPPGCGKTSLANIINEICIRNCRQYKFVSISATSANVIKDIQDIVLKAKKSLNNGLRTVLFIDEIHRLTKSQQKSFLIHIQRAEVTLIGATTENPSFALNSSFLNCCKVVVMEKLDSNSLILIIEKALEILNIGILDDTNTIRNMYQTKNVRIHRSAIKFLADTSDGDARIALNNLQLILQYNNNKKLLRIADIKNQIKKAHLLYDRNGEEHHNIISAMHESIKGYNDNATIYWTTRMLVGGEDPVYIARRLIRTSSEDTGNADPKALRLAISTMQGCEVLDKSDANVLVAQCAIYLSRAPTNKQTITALNLAKKVISEHPGEQPSIPIHLRNISVKLMKELEAEIIAEKGDSFMPDGLENVNFL